MNNITALFSSVTALLIIKAITLVILFCFIIFTIILFIQIRALNRSVHMTTFFAAKFIVSSAFLYIVASISLFIAALVIL